MCLLNSENFHKRQKFLTSCCSLTFTTFSYYPGLSELAKGSLKSYPRKYYTLLEHYLYKTYNLTDSQSTAWLENSFEKPRFWGLKTYKPQKSKIYAFCCFFWWNFIQIIFNCISLSSFASFVIIYRKWFNRENGV